MSLFVTDDQSLLVVSDDDHALTVIQETPILVTVQEDGVLFDVEERPTLHVSADQPALSVFDASPSFFTAGDQGPEGAQGPAGPSGASTITITAGEAVSGHKAVYASSGQVFHADNATLAHVGRVVGITVGAASLGATATIQASGEMSEGSWTWNDGPIYIGTNGALTQTRPSSGWVVAIATALSSTKILIHRTASIVRA